MTKANCSPVVSPPGNIDDRVPVPHLVKQLWGKLLGDKGYLSQKLCVQLLAQDLHLITKLRRNMQGQLMPLLDKLLLRKRTILESIIDQLKNISQIEHTRHRSLQKLLGDIMAGLIAYTWRPPKRHSTFALAMPPFLAG